jgi:GGDEF domain-containing protein
VKGVSIGISLYPADAQDVDSLLNMADQAMYSAKKSGNGGCRFS